jgi:hypothetical protein
MTRVGSQRHKKKLTSVHYTLYNIFTRPSYRERTFVFFSARQRDKLRRKQSSALFAEYFGDRIKRKRSWPSLLPALKPCDFFLSDSVKDKFCICSPDAAGDLIGNIQNTVCSVPPSQFHSAVNLLLGVTRDQEPKTTKLSTSLKCKM